MNLSFVSYLQETGNWFVISSGFGHASLVNHTQRLKSSSLVSCINFCIEYENYGPGLISILSQGRIQRLFGDVVI